MTPHRRQIHDDINDGKLKLADLDMSQLRDLLIDWDMDYNPDEPFVTMIRHEVERREAQPKVKKKYNRNFY